MSWLCVFSYDWSLLSWENTFSLSMLRDISLSHPDYVLVFCLYWEWNSESHTLSKRSTLSLPWFNYHLKGFVVVGFCCCFCLLCVLLLLYFDNLLLDKDLDWSSSPSPLLLTVVSALVAVTNASFFRQDYFDSYYLEFHMFIHYSRKVLEICAFQMTTGIFIVIGIF